MLGGSQSDSPLDFSSHDDEVSYADRVNPVRADLEGDGDDGERGERDQIGSDVESIVGGAGADILAGSAVANWLDGGHGADLLTSGAGNDLLLGGRHTDRCPPTACWPDRGQSGRDRIRPGSRRDNIFGGPGNDILRTRDSRAEDVHCGGGWDRVLPDPFFDGVKDGCERILRRPSRR
jgi:Ca2+-binding RTX toxin-like protein